MLQERASLKGVDLRIEKDGVRAQVVRVLRQAIIAGEFLPGQRLVEIDLCEALQISRPSLREALRHLESERLVTFVPNRGCFVAAMEWADAEHIYETRLLLEPEMVARAAERIQDVQLSELTVGLEQFRLAVAQNSKLDQVSASDHFYQAIFSAAGNTIIEEILKGLNARISVLRARSMSRSGRAPHSLAELEAIRAALIARNPEEARLAARRHIENACASARAAMSGDAAGPSGTKTGR